MDMGSMDVPGSKRRLSRKRIDCSATRHIIVEERCAVTAQIKPNRRTMVKIAYCQYN
jgi:hypothetical protein